MRSILFVIFLLKNSEESFNYHDSDNIYHLGTKTPYRIVENKDDNLISYPGCFPEKIIGIIRHGTRTPGLKNVEQMINVLSTVREDFMYSDNASNSSTDFSNVLVETEKAALKNWTFFMDTKGEKFLTPEGGREMFGLAKRLQSRFPSLLSTYKNSSFLFKFTKTQRTEESAKHFAYGLFGKNNNELWFPEPEDPDPVLRFYKLCKKWRKEVKKSKASTKERNDFSKAVEMQNVLRAVSNRLALNYTLSFDSVQLMYSTCAFETAWFSEQVSPWCNLFKNTEIKVLEYAEELKYYWRDGYGFDINYKQSCPLFKNILDFLVAESERHAVFYFTHSGTLLKSLSQLALYRDPFPLKADLDPVQKESRLWRVSYIDTFGANIIFTLFLCEGDIKKVLVTHQERQVQLTGCPPPPHLCPLPMVSQVLEPHKGCDFHQICDLK